MNRLDLPPDLRAGPVVDRADFPALDREVDSQPLVYLDTAATALKPRQVIDAEAEFYRRYDGAVHRGSHAIGLAATEIYEQARAKTAAFFGVQAPEIIWVKNATEALNLVAYGLLAANIDARAGSPIDERLRIQAGDTIAVTVAEHHANFVPWQQLAKRLGAHFHVVDTTDTGELRPEAFANLPDRTRVLAVTHASNVTGALTPVAAAVSAARERGALTVLDACQSAAHLPLDFHQLDVDFAAASAHKLMGPTGLGILYGRTELLRALPPFLTGGSMVALVERDRTIFLDPPQKFEAGTQMTAQVAAMGAAIDYLHAAPMERIASYDLALGAYLRDQISEIDGVRIIGPQGGKHLGLVAFAFADIHPHDVGQVLDVRGIAVRVGHHCAQPIHRRLGVQSSTRASVGAYTTVAEVDAFIVELARVTEFFRR
ncbi:MAG: SufS family cysteine desulfurase [Bowdeniella nasicola]|nr:SufS family cysteine desulfurase [Bowdeniella nasicola]